MCFVVHSSMFFEIWECSPTTRHLPYFSYLFGEKLGCIPSNRRLCCSCYDNLKICISLKIIYIFYWAFSL